MTRADWLQQECAKFLSEQLGTPEEHKSYRKYFTQGKPGERSWGEKNTISVNDLKQFHYRLSTTPSRLIFQQSQDDWQQPSFEEVCETCHIVLLQNY